MPYDKDWFDYISKLNDRALKKRRASGFTNWAVVGLLGYLFYGILDRLPSITSGSINADVVLIFLTNIVNSSLILFVLVLLIIIKAQPNVQARLSTRLDRSSAPITLFVFIIFVPVLIYFNLKSAYYFNVVPVSKWPYYTFCILLILNLVTELIKKAKLAYKSKSVELPTLEIDPVFLHGDRLINAILLFIFATFFGICIFAWYEIIVTISISNYINELKISIEVTGIIGAVYYLVRRLLLSMKENFLEVLERRIVLEELTPDKIKSIFITEFLGQTTRDWMMKVQSEIDEAYKAVIDNMEKAKSEFINLKDIDSQYKYEIEARAKKICKSIEDALDIYFKVVNKSSDQVSYLVSNRAFLYDDPDLLKSYISLWKKQSSDINKTYSQICKSCIISASSSIECKE